MSGTPIQVERLAGDLVYPAGPSILGGGRAPFTQVHIRTLSVWDSAQGGHTIAHHRGGPHGAGA